LQDR
jgi:archaellum component FlaC